MTAMTKTHITKHDHGDGTHSETRTTIHPRGTVVEKTYDTTDRNVLGGERFIEKTVTDPDGNSKTTHRSK
jgi:hypothetical protein